MENKNNPSRTRHDAGYTLLELLIVLAIIGTLMATVAPRLLANVEKSERVAAKAQVKTMRLALDSYRLDTGAYPSAEQGLSVLVTPPAGDDGSWAGPYLEGGIPLDPWKNPYVYQPPLVTDTGRNTVPVVISYGADKAPGGQGNNKDVSSS